MEWYEDVGETFIWVMVVKIAKSTLFELVFLCLRKIKNRFANEDDFNYLKKHLGNELSLTTNYAETLYVVFVTSMFCIGIPILIPAAIFTIAL